jgi:tight adherence protein B
MQLLILFGTFLTVIFLTLGLYALLFSSRLAVLERLQASTAVAHTWQQGEAAGGKGFSGEFLHFLGTLGKMLSRRRNLKKIRQKLLQAHILMRSEEFIGLSIFSGAALLIAVYLLTGGAVAVAVLAALVGFKIPDIYVDLKKTRRINALTQQLPEALTIVSSGLRAGFSFPQAMSVVSREMGPPIGEEFSRVLWENRMGKPLEEVLLNLGERAGSYDMNLLINALLIQRQLGGNLAEILDNITHTIRERVRIKGEIKTLTAQGRLSALIIILLPIAVAAFLVVMNPEYMLTLVREPLGLVMVSLAVVLQFLGIFIIRKIINIEV